MKKIYLTLCLILLFLLSAPVGLYALDVGLQWDASVTPGVEGYKIHYRQKPGSNPGEYNNVYHGGEPIDAGDVLTYTVTGLPDGIFCFAATAYLGEDESDFSNEACIPPKPPVNLQFIPLLLLDEDEPTTSPPVAPDEPAPTDPE